MQTRLFFEYNNQVIQLPVNPAELSVKSNGVNKTEEIVNLGEINILKDTKLQECSITSFLPQNANMPFVLTAGRFESPQFYIDFFETVRKDKKPCRFVVSNTKINMLVSIESFEHKLQAGDEDVYYTLKLKEYRTYSAKVIKLQQTANTEVVNTVVESSAQSKTGFAIGDTVIVNGRYFADSYGGGNSGNFNNFNGKISLIVADKTRAYRYHITTLEGGPRGWVSSEQMTHK